MSRWLERADVPRGADYDARWETLAASGTNVHGEADLIMWCLTSWSARQGPQASGAPRVLDAGCGTGRVSIELERRGVQVVGVDLDPAMLAQARAKRPEGTWIEADLATLQLRDGPSARRFDLIALPGNVMIFLAPGSEGVVLQRLAEHLEPGGLLLAGFQLGAGKLTLERYDELAAAAGMTLVDRFATWDRAPFVAGGDYAVSLHRADATAR